MWNPTIELRGVFTRRAAVEEADLLAYLAERQEPTRADLVDISAIARDLAWDDDTALAVVKRLARRWLLEVVEDNIFERPFVFITELGRERAK